MTPIESGKWNKKKLSNRVGYTTTKNLPPLKRTASEPSNWPGFSQFSLVVTVLKRNDTMTACSTERKPRHLRIFCWGFGVKTWLQCPYGSEVKKFVFSFKMWYYSNLLRSKLKSNRHKKDSLGKILERIFFSEFGILVQKLSKCATWKKVNFGSSWLPVDKSRSRSAAASCCA